MTAPAFRGLREMWQSPLFPSRTVVFVLSRTFCRWYRELEAQDMMTVEELALGRSVSTEVRSRRREIDDEIGYP